MRLGGLLPCVAVVITLVSLLPAQEKLPDSYQLLLATVERLEKMAPNDVRVLTSRAQAGDEEAQYLLALIYGDGQIVSRDLAVSRQWMMKAAEQGYIPAQVGMGKMYLVNAKSGPVPSYGDADRWLRLAAMQGDAEGQFWLGAGYERGYFGTTDYREALKWLRKAAAQGLPDAQYALGEMYDAGEGVVESAEMAARWYRKAADHFSDVSGVWEAELQLNYMYRDDRLPKDYVEAYMWATVVGSSVDPPDDTDMKRAAQHLSRAQIAEGQRRAEDWIRRHTRQPKNVVVPALKK